MSALASLPRATLREIAICSAVGRPTEPALVTLVAESLLDSLDEIPGDFASVYDDAADLPSFVKDIVDERDEAKIEEGDAIRDLKSEVSDLEAKVEDLESENDKLGDKIADLESGEEHRALREQIQTLTRERDEARAETRDIRRKILAVVSEDQSALCKLPGCYNEAHSSDGRCTFHRGDEPPPAQASPAPKKRGPRKVRT